VSTQSKNQTGFPVFRRVIENRGAFLYSDFMCRALCQERNAKDILFKQKKEPAFYRTRSVHSSLNPKKETR